METIKNKGQRFHVGCGGEVIRGVCLKCGEKQERNLAKRIFGEGSLIIKDKDVEETKRKAHRQRIREGKDIFK